VVLELIERDSLAADDEGFQPLLSPGQRADLMRMAIQAIRAAAGHAEGLLAADPGPRP
jgi:hypothetical protein